MTILLQILCRVTLAVKEFREVIGI